MCFVIFSENLVEVVFIIPMKSRDSLECNFYDFLLGNSDFPQRGSNVIESNGKYLQNTQQKLSKY